MPRLNTDYSKTIIYKIVCKDLNVTDLYVGSTTKFATRKSQHKTICNSEKSKAYNFKVYKMIRDNGGWNNWDMLEIEKFECTDGNESRARERHWYEELEAKMNTCVPNRSDEEYRADHADKIKQYRLDHIEDSQKYRDEHRAAKKEYNKAYYAKRRGKPLQPKKI